MYESGFALSLHSDIVVPYIHEFGTEAARELYAGSPSVHVLDPGDHPDTLWVRGSNRVHVAYTQDPGSGKIIAMSAIDNLVKGAAGQALQCLNVRFGLEEGAGLGAHT